MSSKAESIGAVVVFCLAATYLLYNHFETPESPPQTQKVSSADSTVAKTQLDRASSAAVATDDDTSSSKNQQSSSASQMNDLLKTATATSNDTFDGGDPSGFAPDDSDGSNPNDIPVKLYDDTGQRFTFIWVNPFDASYLTSHICDSTNVCQQTFNDWVHSNVNYDKQGILLCSGDRQNCVIYTNALKIQLQISQQQAAIRFLQWSNSPITDSAGNPQ